LNVAIKACVFTESRHFVHFKRTRNMTHSYCVRCRKMTASTHEIRAVSKNKRQMVRGRCSTCRATKTRFIKQKGGDLVSSLNAITGRVKLPWSKFTGEMHLPGHNFTGPGTKLQKRLNADGTPKTWSKPVNRVDSAAYHHDLAYARYKDTAKRIAADKKMLKELDDISNPTLKERMERAIIKPVLSAKVNFGF